MIKQETILEVKNENRSYKFHCNPDSPIGEIFDALCQMRGFVIQKIVAEQENQKPQEEPASVPVAE